MVSELSVKQYFQCTLSFKINFIIFQNKIQTTDESLVRGAEKIGTNTHLR